MTAHASSIAEYGCVAISNNFTVGSGIKQYASAILSLEALVVNISRSAEISNYLEEMYNLE